MKTFDSREGYDLYAPHYKKDHAHLDSFDWDLARGCIAATIQQLLVEKQPPESTPVARVLDLGCGDARVLKRLIRLAEQKSWGNQVAFTGWDISEGMLKQARKALPASVVLEQRDLLELTPLGNNGFDVVLSFFVLVHIKSPLLFLNALAAVLKPGAFALFNSIPQREAMVLEASGKKFQIEYEHHQPDEILQSLSVSGFELVEQHTGQWSDLFLIKKIS